MDADEDGWAGGHRFSSRHCWRFFSSYKRFCYPVVWGFYWTSVRITVSQPIVHGSHCWWFRALFCERGTNFMEQRYWPKHVSLIRFTLLPIWPTFLEEKIEISNWCVNCTTAGCTCGLFRFLGPIMQCFQTFVELYHATKELYASGFAMDVRLKALYFQGVKMMKINPL